MEIKVKLNEDSRFRQELTNRTDSEARRIERYLSMPDLARTPGSPINEIVERVKKAHSVKDFDIIEIPEIVPADISFDLFDFPDDHPARSKSDTYYVDEQHILRTHDTVFWYYYLNQPEIKERIARREAMGALCYGKVYRKDEIDSRHMNVFHQIGGWYIAPDERPVTVDDMKAALSDIAKSVFGPETAIRFNPDTFPYTDPSLEVEIDVKGTAAEGPARGEWLEIMGGGMPKKSVLKKMDVEGYHGWAFGFGIERLAIASMALPDIRLLWSDDERVKRQLKLGQAYKEVSKYPPITRDISFIVPKTFVPNDYFDLIRELGGDLVEEVELLDKYENDEKFGTDKMSYTYRIIYRSISRTLKTKEIDPIQAKIEEETKKQFVAEIR